MNISIQCDVFLSKKLRALVGPRADVVLNAFDLQDGKGIATLTISVDKEDVSEQDILIGETSIMLVPKQILDIAPNITTREHGIIFSDLKVKKIATVEPPETKEDISKRTIALVQTPEPFKALEERPEIKDYIRNLEELIGEVNAAKNKVSTIDLTTIDNPLKKAVAEEQKEREEAIDKDAWIVSEQASILTINDLGITLSLNSPFNLSNISAKRILLSRELRTLIKSGLIRFCSPKEVEVLRNKAIQQLESTEEKVCGLKATGVDEAWNTLEKKMSRSVLVEDNPSHLIDMNAVRRPAVKTVTIDEENAVVLTPDELEGPTEEENMINLTGITDQVTKEDFPVSMPEPPVIIGNRFDGYKKPISSDKKIKIGKRTE